MSLSSLNHVIGQSTVFTSSAVRFVVAHGVLDFETDIANIKSEWIVPALMNLINDKQISRWNATQLDNYADLVCYGAQLLAELKPQIVIPDYVPGITRVDDGSDGYPFTRATTEGLLASLTDIKIPPMSYALVNMYDKVIQRVGAEPDSGTLASYYYPFHNTKSYAQIETLLGTIASLYDAAVYATQANQMLIPFDHQWLQDIKEVSLISQFALTLSQYQTTVYDNGGAETETEEAFDGTTDFYYSQILGIPEYADALAIFRGTSGAPHCYEFEAGTINNDMLSFFYCDAPSDTVFTEMGKATTHMDWMYPVATGASRTQVGPYIRRGEGIFMVHYDNILPNAAAWDRRMAAWLAKHSRDPSIPEVTLPILPDIQTTIRRGGPQINPFADRQRGASSTTATDTSGGLYQGR
jgi:hypothetical protein